MDYLFSDEQLAFRDKITRWTRDSLTPLASVFDGSDNPSPELFKMMADEGLFRVMMPKEFGGGETIRCVDACIVREGLSRVCSMADVAFAMQSLSAYPIIQYGNEIQKKKYLPPIAAGEKIASFALSEPEAGSDVAGMKTQAVLDGAEYVLNGEKMWATRGHAADIFVVFAKTDPPSRGKGISAFIVEKGVPGFEGHDLVPLMDVHGVGHLRFKNCRVPAENLLGKEGQGMKVGLGNLDMFRPTVGAAAVGLSQRAFEEALNRAKVRTAFNRPISDFQITQFKLADMATSLQAARLMVYHAALLKDKHGDPKEQIKAASMAKVFATEACAEIVDEAVQIHGGTGLVKGVPVERLYRQARLMRIYEGTSEIQPITIARSLLK
jgi:alkylation response protein AidB-like acyl-CoA dehydrogenase